MRLELRGQPGAGYALELSNNLTGWSELVTGIFPAEGLVILPASPQSVDRSFYRVRSIP
jgi:hypothetical protein